MVNAPRKTISEIRYIVPNKAGSFFMAEWLRHLVTLPLRGGLLWRLQRMSVQSACVAFRSGRAPRGQLYWF